MVSLACTAATQVLLLPCFAATVHAATAVVALAYYQHQLCSILPEALLWLHQIGTGILAGKDSHTHDNVCRAF